jgi:hypothetical protein
MSDSPELVFHFVPSLVSTLLNREQAKGSPLTEQEVLEIRDSYPVIALREETAKVAEEKRGYKDIDPEHVWEEWQEARKYLQDDERNA